MSAHDPSAPAKWLAIVPVAMIAISTFSWFAYTRKLAQEHRDFCESHGITRGVSARFHLFLGRMFSIIGFVVGVLLLVSQLSSR